MAKFQARAQVNFLINLKQFEQKRGYNRTELTRMREIDPLINELPVNHMVKEVLIGMVLDFADELVLDEDTGEVKVFPISFFEKLNANPVELPNPMFGEVSAKAFDNQFSNLPSEYADKFKEELKQANLGGRFIYLDRLVKVK